MCIYCNTFTLPIGPTLAKLLFDLGVVLCSEILAGRNCSTNSHFKEFDYRYVFFWPFVIYSGYEMVTGSGVWICVFLSATTV
jgi:hypothetical protein